MGRRSKRREGLNMRVRVVDGDYIMGDLYPASILPFGTARAVRVTNRWGDSSAAPSLFSSELWELLPANQVPVFDDENGVRYFPCLKLGTRQICIAGRFIGQWKDHLLGEWESEYVVFPDFRISAEKLEPVLDDLLGQGVREIEYSVLRRLLDM